MKYYVLVFMTITLSAVTVFAGALNVSELRCEYMDNPLGIDNSAPQLSWKITGTGQGRSQTAYRVLVASDAAKLKKGVGDLWDSGKVDSFDETAIAYGGKELAWSIECFWKVMVWDEKGKKSRWSKAGKWSMGLDEWTATWVGFDKPRVDAEKILKEKKKGMAKAKAKNARLLPAASFLRKEFRIAKPVKQAMLYASSLGNYEIHINGQRVGNDYFTPGWTDYNKRVYYNTYDVTAMVKKGANAIGGILAEGWYSGSIGYKLGRDFYGKNPRLSAQLVLEYEDGSARSVTTDDTWKASVGPILEGGFLAGETYDARLEIDGWDEAGFDASSWVGVDVTEKIEAKIEAYPSNTVKVFQEIKPLSITEPKKGNFVFDMGTNFAGFVRLKVKGAKGTKITLKFGERLNPDGTVYTKNLRRARVIDTYICKGDGVEIWQPRFTFHGFQYVGVTGFPAKPKRDAITGIELTSATPVAGSFECSDPRLNQLYHNICQTQRANFIDIPTDCPQRDERMGWTGDAQAYVRTACFNSDVQSFFRKWIVDLTDAQLKDGDFPKVAPMVVAGGSGGPAWADAGVICPWAIYQVYADKKILEKHYDAMAKFVDFRLASAPDYLAPKKFHCFGDWLSITKNDTPKDVIYAAYTAADAMIMYEAGKALGKEDAGKYFKLFKKMRTAFNDAYVSDDGTIKGDTQTVYVLALMFDLVKGEKKLKVEKRLIKRIEDSGWHLSTGFVGTRDLLHVLSKIGRHDVAYKLLFTDTYPSWLFPVKNGATSIWERWNSWTPEKGFGDTGMNSFSHYAYGAVGQWMFENIGGIKPKKTGYKEIAIRPYITDKLNWAKTSYDSIHGKIAVDWKRKGEKVTLKVTVPVNTKAWIYVPGSDLPIIVGSGKYTYTCKPEPVSDDTIESSYRNMEKLDQGK